MFVTVDESEYLLVGGNLIHLLQRDHRSVNIDDR